MTTLELFSGTKSFSKVMQAHGHETLTIDNNKKLEPDLCVNVFAIDGLKKVEILWMSPPCTTFSVASISYYWDKGKPKNSKCLEGIAILDKAIKLIAESKPTFWFLENPRGMMRTVIDEIFLKYNVKDYKRNTISYCQYGHPIMKPTDIWTNASWWTPKPICKPGAPCHLRSKNPAWDKVRTSSPTTRGVMPVGIFEEILKQYESNK